MVKTKRNRGMSKARSFINSLSSMYKSANKVYNNQLKDYNNVTLSEVDTMTGEQFEILLANLFIRMGYSVRTTPTTGDYGADLLLFDNSSLIVVQAKRYSSNVGVSAVQEIVSAKPVYSASQAMVVSNAEFTKAAQNLARANGVQLVGRADLANLLRQYAN